MLDNVVRANTCAKSRQGRMALCPVELLTTRLGVRSGNLEHMMGCDTCSDAREGRVPLYPVLIVLGINGRRSCAQWNHGSRKGCQSQCKTGNYCDTFAFRNDTLHIQHLCCDRIVGPTEPEVLCHGHVSSIYSAIPEQRVPTLFGLRNYSEPDRDK